jgi:hypothetical protein
MNFTFINDSKTKGQVIKLLYPTHSQPIANKDYSNLYKLKGPYPTYVPKQSETVTKQMLLPVKSNGSSYYDSFNKTTIVGNVTCTGGTSINTCYKKLPRPLKIWRRRLDPNSSTSKNNITINLLNQPNTVINHDECFGNSKNIYLEQNKESVCDGIKTEGKCLGGTNKITRSAGTIINKKYSTTHSEYLQKRVKTFEQNQILGKKIDTYTYQSGIGIEPTNEVSGVCNKVIFKPSNNRFQLQGGVTSSARTNMYKYMSLMNCNNNTCTNNTNFKNFATSQTTLNSGVHFVKDNRCIKLNRKNGTFSVSNVQTSV